MGHNRNKAFVHIQTGVHELLLSLCQHPDVLVRRQACGCVYELCSDNMRAAQDEFRFFGAESTLTKVANSRARGDEDEIEFLESRRLAVAILVLLFKDRSDWCAAAIALGSPKNAMGVALSVDEKV